MKDLEFITVTQISAQNIHIDDLTSGSSMYQNFKANSTVQSLLLCWKVK